ncbi:O-succinylbenzoate-CoA ligase [Sodalis praecaptivus]|uniref:O-succinylbenzoate-CoA ligase n=1 Tax=Sodalis praecaptivus TaxID=1239307 RepID=W0HW62_9GAMM|nr:o-succinylbenzoate--CoA ligase [Sodalis praecaptivus]AHF76420.1 O-succinylbenzoate-CoA ligase [Sodalis praecaptivus]
MPEHFDDWPWRQWAQRYPHAIALHGPQGELSWRQVAAAVQRQAASWRRAGVVEGCGVALRGHNSLALLFAYLAALECGARVAPLNPRLPAELLARRLPTLDLAFGWSSEPAAWPSGMVPLEVDVARLLLSDPSAAETQPPLPPADTPWDPKRLATLTLTSGSSGMPKAAAHRYAAHLCSAAGVVTLLDFQRAGCWLLSLPLYHVSGQGIVWRWLYAGARLAVQDGVPLAQALAGCSHASLVPTQLWRLLDGSPTSLTLSDVLLGGAMIPAELTTRAEAQGIRCWCGYGLTEFASTVCARRADGAGGVGLPLAGRSLRLVQGEIWLRGASQAAGYWHQGTLLPLDEGDGWFHTRDRGTLHAGELRIAGRLDNLFFCGGEGVQPEDIERLLARHDGVRQAFIAPLADPEYGQRPVAVVDSDVPLAALRAWLEPQLSPWQRPVAWYYLPPTLNQGGIKIPRGAIHAWLAQTPAP